MYDPTVGGFLQRDPVAGTPFAPSSLNRFSYVQNNPTNLADPTGLTAIVKADRGRGCADLFVRMTNPTCNLRTAPAFEDFTEPVESPPSLVVMPGGGLELAGNPGASRAQLITRRAAGLAAEALVAALTGFVQNAERITSFTNTATRRTPDILVRELKVIGETKGAGYLYLRNQLMDDMHLQLSTDLRSPCTFEKGPVQRFHRHFNSWRIRVPLSSTE
jgi:hypothetical protein